MKTIYKGSMFLILLLACALILIGCNKETTSNENKPKTNDTKTADKPADSKPAENKPADNTASTGGDKIGVPECDEYIEKYEACLNSKVPEAQRAAMKSAFEMARKGYKDAASTPQGKSTLAAACKQAMDAAKQATTAYGCTW